MTTPPGVAQGLLSPFGVGTAVYYWLAAVATFMFITALFTKERIDIRKIAVVSIGLALLAIIAEFVELGNVTNITYILTNLNSPIAIDAIGAGLFIIGAAATLILQRAWYVVGSVAVMGAAIWLIGRALLFAASPARPLWSLTPTLLLITSIVLGISAFLLLSYIWRRSSSDVLVHLKALFLIVSLFSYGWLIVISSAWVTIPITAWLGMTLSILAPLALYILYTVTNSKFLVPIAAALVLIGGLFLHMYLFDIGVRTPLPGEMFLK